MELGSMHIFAISLLLLYLIHRIFFKPLTFWKDLGVKGPEPHWIFGNYKQVFFMKESIGEFAQKHYESYPNEPMVGVYTMRQPCLVLKDLDLIKDVCIRDFSTFESRGRFRNPKAEPLLQNLLFLEPEKWRPLRNRLSSIFTSGKLKEMFFLFLESGRKLDSYTDKLIERGQPINVHDLMSKYAVDVIASCAFGLELNSLSDEKNEFHRVSERAMRMDWLMLARFWLDALAPRLYKSLWRLFYDETFSGFIKTKFMETVEYRMKHNIRRNDFVDLLRDLRDNPDKVNNIEFTDDLMVAQAFVFFLAGYETSAAMMSNTLYLLAQYQDIQDKLHEEIKEEFQENNGDLTFESIKKMKYLHKVFQESLRKYPPGNFVKRSPNAPYTFAGTNITIPKEIEVYISIYGIHNNPSIFPNPEVFDPERFNEDAIKARHQMSFMPFGDGPRNCIGSRFAEYQTKVGLAYTLLKNKVYVCEETEIPYEVNHTSILHIPQNGIYLGISKI